MVDEHELSEGDSTVQTLFEDPTRGVINEGFLSASKEIADQTDLDKNKIQEVRNIIFTISTKLASLWIIRKNYVNTLERSKRFVSDPENNRGRECYAVHPTELMAWVDLYLVQVKSTLDYLVKLPSPIFGLNKWSLSTFGKKGETVRKAFNNLPKEYENRTANFYDIIFGEQAWIDSVIHQRDRLNHGLKGGGDRSVFLVAYSTPSGMFEIPMWSGDQSMQNAMGVIFEKLVFTCAIFSATMLSLRLPDQLTVVCETADIKSCEPICRVVRKESMEEIKRHFGATE